MGAVAPLGGNNPTANKSKQSKARQSKRQNNRTLATTASSLHVARIPKPIGFAGAGASGMVHAFVPDSMRRTIRYSDYSALAGTSGALASWVFNAAGLYDPDTSFGGHQPFGFDQIMAFYSRYTVLSARITVDAIAVSVPIFMGIAVNPNAAAVYSNYGTYIESGSTSYRLIDDPTPGNNRITTAVEIAKFVGAVDVVDDPDRSGTTAANPVSGLYFHVLVQDVNKTSTCNAEVNVVIDFDVVFTLPRSLTQS